jgi:undecaprenyl-diphosphatase
MNNSIFFFFYNLAHQSVFLDNLLIFFAQTFPYLVIGAAIVFLLWHHEIFSAEHPFRALAQKWKEIVLVFFSGIFAWILAHFLKILIHSPRPFAVFPYIHSLISETDFSFPSGHATFYMGLAFAIFLSHKKAGYWFIFFALIIGIARIVAGIHFPIDILGGFILGIIIAYLVRIVYDKIYRK